MGGCCVKICKNNDKNSKCKFYRFPTAPWKLDQRNKWIAAVNRKNLDGSPWSPKYHHTICSEHFIGGKKSDAQASPSYILTIFSTIYQKKKVNDSHVPVRYIPVHISLIKRRIEKVTGTTSNRIEIEEGNDIDKTQPLVVDQGCQVNVFSKSNIRETTFICNRFIYSDHCDAEIQVDIATTSRIIMTNKSRKKNKSNSYQCNSTDKKLYMDQATETES